MRALLAFVLMAGGSILRAEQLEADLCVYEATPGGIAMAVRAAREGLHVALVNHGPHLGGILSSGLGVWDTLWEGKRAPIYDEARQAIFDHYLTHYGADSPQYRDALPGRSGHTNGKFEPQVAESVLTTMVTREPRITVVRGQFPVSVQRAGELLKSVTFREVHGSATTVVVAAVYADCSYEGDLFAVAGVPYRVGRESRAEFQEPHAGVIYMAPHNEAPSPELRRAAELHDQLNLRKFRGFQSVIEPASSGTADGNVQAFNYRTILTKDPARRLPMDKPANYDPASFRDLEHGSIVAPIPNQKIGWNRPQLVGLQTAYVEADWPTRQRIMDAHWEATVGLLYFLQHDPTVPPARQEFWRAYGLAADEFTDHGHRPYEMYVREARRIVGRYVFTQHDAMLSPGLDRAPVHADSIGVTEWYLDTHACTPRSVEGSLADGKMMLDVETFPGQLPYRAILPRGIDNLLVPVCLSCTHVAWGTVRLEPTWMHLCESAAHAAVLAVQQGCTPAAVDADALRLKLAESHIMLNFFNDLDVASEDPCVVAAQYFGTLGFFADYDARLDAPLTEEVAAIWKAGLRQFQEGRLEPMQFVERVRRAESTKSGDTASRDTARSRGDFLLAQLRRLSRKD